MDAPSAEQNQAPHSSPVGADQDVSQNKDIAAFSYLWIMSVIVFVLRRDSAFVRFHAKQAMLLFLLSLLAWFIPVIGRLLEFVLFAGMVMGFVNAAQGERKDVPLVGQLSRGEISVRQAWKQIVDLVASLVRAAKEMAHSSKKTEPAKPADPAPATPPMNHTPPQDASSSDLSSPPTP